MMRSIALAGLACTLALSGCATAPDPHGPYVQEPTMSWAWNVTAYAGYPNLIRDNPYRQQVSLEDQERKGIMLPGSLVQAYPLTRASVVTAPLHDGEDYDDAEVVRRVLLEQYEVRAPRTDLAHEEARLQPLLRSRNLAGFVCRDYQAPLLVTTVSTGAYTHECLVPGFEEFSVYVKAVREADGSEFGPILGLSPGRYTVLTVRSDLGDLLIPRPLARVPIFQFKDGVYVVNSNELPFVGPDSAGKRLVFLGGQPRLL
ncbi:hypothetical protein ACEUDJ_14565 [Aeromonas bivalvium]|uniref:DUF3299 domain-containing protein n=1 Tax=Aeromonas bivalvium TaxID=440079 RepID=A0ABW9GSG2_9GAMM